MELVSSASLARAITVDDARFGEVVWGHFELDSIAQQQLDPVAAQAAGDVRQHGMPVLELDREGCAGKHLFDGPKKLEWSFFRGIWGLRCRSVIGSAPRPISVTRWTGQTFSFCLAGSARSISQPAVRNKDRARLAAQ
jgi:hypothetical protein